jgi:hypothetical protein
MDLVTACMKAGMSGRVAVSASESGAVACSTLASEIEHLLRFFLERCTGLCLTESSRHNPFGDLLESFVRVIPCRVVERHGEIDLLHRQIRSGETILFHSGSLLLTIGHEKGVRGFR